MTTTDKEKLEEIKACLDVYDKSLPKLDTDKKKLDNMDWLIGLVRKILEKSSLTDEQGYQEALELDEEDRLVLLKKEEKLEAIKEIIEEWRRPIRIEDGRILGIEALNQIRKVLEK